MYAGLFTQMFSKLPNIVCMFTVHCFLREVCCMWIPHCLQGPLPFPAVFSGMALCIRPEGNPVSIYSTYPRANSTLDKSYVMLCAYAQNDPCTCTRVAQPAITTIHIIIANSSHGSQQPYPHRAQVALEFRHVI